MIQKKAKLLFKNVINDIQRHTTYNASGKRERKRQTDKQKERKTVERTREINIERKRRKIVIEDKGKSKHDSQF